MTTDQILLFSLFGIVFALLLWGRWRYDVVAFGALVAGVLLDVVPSASAFAGFGHPATVVVALVLVVSAGLVRSGAVLLITRTLVDAGRKVGSHVAIMGAVGAALSAFMNNVAALALLMPVDVATARKAGRAPGLTLMPLSFATILGGMATLIGTPPNIIVAGIREDALGAPFAMFDFAPVGIAVAAVGLAFVALIGWRLIPAATSPHGTGDPLADAAEYVAELHVPDDHHLVGAPLAEVAEEAARIGAGILGIVRGRRRVQGAATIEPGDAIVVQAPPAAIDELRATLKLDHADAARLERLGGDVAVIEAVVEAGSRLDGTTAARIGLAFRRRAILLGISRRSGRSASAVRDTVLRPGDIVLLLVPRGEEEAIAGWLGVLTLAGKGLEVTDAAKVWLAIGIFAGAVAAASFGLVYLPVALGAVVVLYVLLGVLPLAGLYDHIEWPVVVLLGSMIPLGAALETSGGTALISGWLTSLTAGLPAWATLTVLMLVTMTLSDVLNNTATVIVAAPVALGVAETLGVSPDPFLMAVAVAASCAFLTPIGHKNNTLVMGPGGYGFGSYWRMGLPLEILVVAVGVPMILLVWPLS